MAEVCYIESPKLLPPKGIDFSTNGKFMALIQKKSDCKNTITVFYAGHDWKIVNGFEINDVHDPRDCKWVMGNMGIMVQDNPIECQFVIYSAMTGSIIVKHTPDSHLGLGIRRISFSPNDKQIAVGLYDSNLVIYNNVTQNPITELEHKPTITLNTRETRGQADIFKEEICRNNSGGVQM